MGLHDRLRSTSGGNGAQEAVIARVESVAREAQPEHRVADPYAELKTRVHHACIAKLGPELFSARTNEDLSERVLRAVTEQLALDQTPLTRDERRQIVREISDDILGYGPLEPMLRDDSVTEIMVNGPDRIYVERAGKL
jgi:pilus assembly protein CpaF